MKDLNKWLTGKKFYQEGLTAPGQRHNAVMAVGYYLFCGDQEAGIPAMPYGCETERFEALKNWIEKKHNGHSETWLTDPDMCLSEMKDMVDWKPDRGNRKSINWQADEALERIISALESNSAITSVRQLAQLSGVSRNTIRKHQDVFDAYRARIAQISE